MDQFTSEEARKEWRRVLNKVENGEVVAITRYGKPLAVITSAEWHDIALAVHGAVNAVTHDGDGNRLPEDTTLTVGDLWSAIGEAAIEDDEREELITTAEAADLIGKTPVRLSDWDTRRKGGRS